MFIEHRARGSLVCHLPLLFLWALVCSPGASGADAAMRITVGAGHFVFLDEKGDLSKPITVYSYLPVRVKADGAPIVFIMHGHSRTAQGYRNDWAQHAEKYGFMVLAPLFDTEQWGRGQYSYSSVADRDGKLRSASMWSFSVIEHLFDAVKAATGNKSARYFLYGFSEGGQFVHRLVLLLPDARYARAVAANSGWYTMPRFDIKFPYGLGGSPVTEALLKKSLGRDVILMLGDADTDPDAKDLRKTRQAMAQGAHRFERGLNFFKEARSRAGELRTTFRWRLKVVPGVAHQPGKMSGDAAAVLMER